MSLLLQQVPAHRVRPACLGMARTVSRPAPLRSRMLCRAALPTSSCLGTPVRPLGSSTLVGLAPRGAQQRQQQQQGRGSNMLVRADKCKSYMFEVEWTGNEQQLQSGQAEQVRGTQGRGVGIRKFELAVSRRGRGMIGGCSFRVGVAGPTTSCSQDRRSRCHTPGVGVGVGWGWGRIRGLIQPAKSEAGQEQHSLVAHNNGLEMNLVWAMVLK